MVEKMSEVMQCRKLNSTIFGKFISPNPGQILSSPFYGKYMTHHTSIWFRRIAPFVAESVYFLCTKTSQIQLF